MSISAMSHVRADAILNAVLRSPATPHLWLHTASPGPAGTDAVALLGASPIVRKPIVFGAPENNPDVAVVERRVLNTANITWTGAEISVGQTLTHVSIWSAATGGTLEFLGALVASRVPGSDGVIVAVGDLEVGLGVFIEP